MPLPGRAPEGAGDHAAVRGEAAPPRAPGATQFSILAALALKGPTPIGELAEVLGLERTTLTRSATRLEDRGWVESADTEDARQRLLRLAPAGRRKLEEALPAWKEAQDRIDRQRETHVPGRGTDH